LGEGEKTLMMVWTAQAKRVRGKWRVKNKRKSPDGKKSIRGADSKSAAKGGEGVAGYFVECREVQKGWVGPKKARAQP